MIRCPKCGEMNNRVFGHYENPRRREDTVRYRKCYSCGSNFKTYEYAVFEENISPEGKRPNHSTGQTTLHKSPSL